MAYGDFEDLTRRTASDKTLCEKEFYIAKAPKHDRYQTGLTSMFYKCFNKNTSGSACILANISAVKNENISNKELVEELHKPVIKI